MLLRLPFFFFNFFLLVFFGFALSSLSLSLLFSTKGPPRALPAATAGPTIDQVGRRVVRVLFVRKERVGKRCEFFQCLERRFFSPAIVGLSFRPSSAQHDRHLCPSLATLLRAHRRLHFTSPDVATAMNESLRAADMAKTHTQRHSLGRKESFFLFRV